MVSEKLHYLYLCMSVQYPSFGSPVNQLKGGHNFHTFFFLLFFVVGLAIERPLSSFGDNSDNLCKLSRGSSSFLSPPHISVPSFRNHPYLLQQYYCPARWILGIVPHQGVKSWENSVRTFFASASFQELCPLSHPGRCGLDLRASSGRKQTRLRDDFYAWLHAAARWLEWWPAWNKKREEERKKGVEGGMLYCKKPYVVMMERGSWICLDNRQICWKAFFTTSLHF